MKKKKRKSIEKPILNVMVVFFGLGTLGLYAFGNTVNGTMANDLQRMGIIGFGLFALWLVKELWLLSQASEKE